MSDGVDEVERWVNNEAAIRVWLATCVSRFGLTFDEPAGSRLARQLSVLLDRGDLLRPDEADRDAAIPCATCTVPKAEHGDKEHSWEPAF